MQVLSFKKLFILILLFFIYQLGLAQTQINAFGFKLEVPSDWKLKDEQKDFKFIDIRHPEKDAFIDIRTQEGDSDKLSKDLIFNIKGLASKSKMDVSKLTDEAINNKLQPFKSPKGLNFLMFSHWEENNPDKKKRYLHILIAKSGKTMTIFSYREITETGKNPEFYTIIRKAFEDMTK